MRSILLASAAVLMLTATPALAQDDSATGLYIQLNGGITSLSDLDIDLLDVDGAGTDVGTSARTKSSAEFGGAIGYDFGLIRAEVEVAYSRARNNALTLKTVNGTAVPANAVQDFVNEGIDTDVIDLSDATDIKVDNNTISYGNGPRIRRLSAMANLWLDLPVNLGGIQPYVGGGIGMQGSEVQGEGKVSFAWQLGAGASLPVTSSIAITADYRHREQAGYTLSDSGYEYARIGKAKSNSFALGLRVTF